MADIDLIGVAETGTYSTSAPNPHVDLSGSSPGSYGIEQLVGDIAANGDKVRLTVRKDRSNWAVYRGATYTTGSPNIIDLSGATLEDSKGTLSNSDSVEVIGIGFDRNMVAPGGRLTLTTGVPITTADVTGASTIYYTPFVHDQITLWDGAIWRTVEFAETSLALSGLTSGKPYDVFAYLDSGSLALETLIWTDDTTRATAVTLQDGRYCKSGDKTRLLLGSFYSTGATTTEDSEANRYLSNLYNVTSKNLSHVTNDAGHTYNSSTHRPYNNSTTHRVNFMLALGNLVKAAHGCYLYPASGTAPIELSIALDNITAPDTSFILLNNANAQQMRASGNGYKTISAGKHYLQLMQRIPGGGVTGNYSYGLLTGELPC